MLFNIYTFIFSGFFTDSGPRSDDIIYLFMLLFSIKGQIDIITFIRNAKRDLKQEAMK